jgi:hypothetical protein
VKKKGEKKRKEEEKLIHRIHLRKMLKAQFFCLIFAQFLSFFFKEKNKVKNKKSI